MSEALMEKLKADKQNGLHGRLLRGYLHKTSNCLCGIKGYASLIADGAGPDPDTSRWAQRIISEIEHLEHIFRSVGDLTAPSAPREPGLHLAGLVDQVMAEAAAARPGLVVTGGAIPAARLLLPAADLRLVLRELVANGAEGRDGRVGAASVAITATVRPTGTVAVRVRDDGPGMAPELAAQAMEPFVTTKDGHAGVGLTRVETLMDMYGLAWQLASEPGRGTSVTLDVAAADGHAA